MAPMFEQSVNGVTPPLLAEGRIREIYPSVGGSSAIAGLGRLLTNTIILAPVGWLVMSLVYFGKLAPIFMRRYTLTNRRVMIRKGWAGTVSQELPLSNIDDVRIVTDGNSAFFRSGTLELVHNGAVALTLTGVPEPDSFRQLIVNSRNAWVPAMSKQHLPFIPASATN